MLVWLLVAMTLSGVVGGLINYLLAEKPAPTGWRLRKWWQYVVLGLGASFTVPLFLNTISSPLVADVVSAEMTPQSASKLLVVAGFCILAAVTSRAFMQSLASKVLKVAEEAKQQSEEATAVAKQAKSDVDRVVEPEPAESDGVEYTKALELTAAAEIFHKGNQNQTVGAGVEPQVSSDGPVTPPEARQEAEAESVNEFDPSPAELLVSPVEKRILGSLIESNFTLRSATGIAREVQLNTPLVRSMLETMQHKGLVAISLNPKDQKRYKVTTQGRNVVWMNRDRGEPTQPTET